jgi:hypothetical protein
MSPTPANQQMIDNGNGTYTAQFLSNVEGYVTAIAYRYVPGKVRVDWYNNTNFIKPFQFTEEWSDISKTWSDTDTLFSTNSKNVTAKIYFLLKIPSSDSYTFTINSNDGSSLFVNGQRVVTRLGTTCNCSNKVDIKLIGGEYYDIR